MIIKPAVKVCLWTVIVAASAALCGCAQPPPEPAIERKEEPVSPALPPQKLETLSPQQLSRLPPPKPSEVKEAVDRVFKNAAVVDSNHNPYFLVGDFNGDYSQDIAVVLKSAEGKLEEMNQEYPSWMLKDPFHPTLPPQLRKEPLRVEKFDVLLAVIHGFGSSGWRNPEATQTYLLKNAVGTDVATQPTKHVFATNRGRRIPKLYGDTITQMLEGAKGFLYYTGASYAWYDPKAFKPETEQRIAHRGAAPQR
jgi:hypothetical protein